MSSFLCLPTAEFPPQRHFFPVLVADDRCSKACWALPGTREPCGDAAARTSEGALVIATSLSFLPYLKCFKKDFFSKTVESCSLKMGNL